MNQIHFVGPVGLGLVYLTTQEVADLLGVARSTVTLWCRDGRFPNVEQVGQGRRKFWFIPDSDVAEFERPKRGRPKMQAGLVVKAQQPADAHLEVPGSTSVRTISKHRDTKRGRQNALQAVRYQFGCYRATHGNAAASRCWVERDGEYLDIRDLELEVAVEEF